MRRAKKFGMKDKMKFLAVCLAAGMLGMSAMAVGQQLDLQQAQPVGLLDCAKQPKLAESPGVKSLAAAEGPDPGATDPMAVPAGRYRMFPSQGIGAFLRLNSGLSAQLFATDIRTDGKMGDGTSFDTGAWDGDNKGAKEFFAAAGRIISPGKDDLVWARRSEGDDPTSPNSTVSVRVANPSTPNAPTFSVRMPENLAPRQLNSSDFIAVAHADLDRVVGNDYNYHDEVIVVHADGLEGSNYRYSLDVLNYGTGSATNPELTHTDFLSQAPQFNATPASTSGGTLPSDNIVDVTTGDFDGDGQTEIAVATQRPLSIHLYIYRYVTTNGGHELELVKDYDWEHNSLPAYQQQMADVGTISLAAGDFDGDGKDELALGWAEWATKTISNVKYSDYAINVEMVKFDPNLNATVKSGGVSQHIGGLSDNTFATENRPRIQLAAGQFYFNPPTEPFGKKELLVAWNDTGLAAGPGNRTPMIRIEPIEYSVELTPIRLYRSYDVIDASNPTNKVYSVAVGGFLGTHAPGGKPVVSVAVSYWGGSPMATSMTSRFGLGYLTFAVDGSLQANEWNYYNQSQGVDFRARMPVVAYDQAGRSMYLGTPIHATVYGVPTLEYVLQEPPKHSYWDEKSKQVINFTRYDGNNVYLSKSDTASLLTSAKDESSISVSASTAIDAAFTVGVGGNMGKIQSTVENDKEFMLQLSYDYNQNDEKYNSQYSEQTFSTIGQTDRDDYLIGKQQNFDIWRYRVFDSSYGGAANNYYEIVLPGSSYEFHGGGLNFDWYQPIQENGNILTYPSQLGSGGDPYLPDDLTAFQLPNGKNELQPIVPASRNYFDGNSGSQSLDYSSVLENGSSFTSSHTFSETLDYKYSTAGQFTAFGSTGTKFSACASFEEHNTDSWSKSKSSTETTKAETSIVLNKAAGLLNTTYPFYPVVYLTSDGATRMSFAVPNPASPETNPAGHEKYAQQYGAHPDPALNLPYRLVPKPQGSGFLETWIPNLDNDRMKMRGILFRHADTDTENGEHDLYGFNPTAGDKVRVETRVYNMSTAQTAYNTVVSFQVIPYDEATDNELCDNPINIAAGKDTGLLCPRSARKEIGTAVVPRLDPLQFTCLSGMDNSKATGCATPVYFNWDTTGFGPDKGTTEYRVYVVLNPSNQGGTETYPIEPDPIQITSVSNTTPLVVTAPGYKFSKGDYVIIGGVNGLDEANGTFTITPVSATEFALDGTTASLDTYAGGGTVALLDPGQNNEGYATIGVTAVPALTAGQAGAAPQDYLTDESLVATPTTGVGALQHQTMTAFKDVPFKLRFTAFSNMVHTEPAHVLLYNGDPSAPGASAVADFTLHPGENGEKGSSVWFKWTPQHLGQHNLYAVLLEAGKPQMAAQMTVNVLADPKK